MIDGRSSPLRVRHKKPLPTCINLLPLPRSAPPKRRLHRTQAYPHSPLSHPRTQRRHDKRRHTLNYEQFGDAASDSIDRLALLSKRFLPAAIWILHSRSDAQMKTSAFGDTIILRARASSDRQPRAAAFHHRCVLSQSAAPSRTRRASCEAADRRWPTSKWLSAVRFTLFFFHA